MTTIYDSIMNEITYQDFIKIINNIPSCIFFKDTELKYRFSSHCWEQLISEDIVGKTDLDIRKDKENAMLAMEMDRNIIQTGMGCKYVIKSEVEGNISYLELTKEPVFNEEGTVIGIVGLINDITEKNTLSQKLEASNEELKTSLEKVERMNAAQKMFTASMNHELRSPLNGIIGLLKLLLEDNTLNETQHGYVDNAYQSSMMMLQIVNDLLDYAKMETNEFTIRKEAFELEDIVNHIEQTCGQMAQQKKLAFRVHVNNEHKQKFYGDDLRIKQIIYNLVSNGIKYTEQGSVDLFVGYREGKLRMKCADTGQGIPKDAMETLFDPYVRIENAKNRKIQGTGLGLSVVKKLVDKMEGEINVQSEVGEGTSFVVTLPMEIYDEKLHLEEGQEEIDFDALDYSKLRALCVDDSKVSVAVFAALLKKTGISLDKAYSGQEGLDLAERNRYDIIFMDHQMPVMDGLETFRKLRKSDTLNKNTPVIILTGNAGEEWEKEYKAMGFDGYLTKPVLKEQLLQEIQRGLRNMKK